MTVIFTSGSTGVPKGVVLTQANISSNVDAIDKVVKLTDSDVLVSVLPFFHSFSYTACLWLTMDLGSAVFTTSIPWMPSRWVN